MFYCTFFLVVILIPRSESLCFTILKRKKGEKFRQEMLRTENVILIGFITTGITAL